MIYTLKVLWRQRRKYISLLLCIAIGAFTVTAVSVAADISQTLLDRELDAMGLNGLIVTGNASITAEQLQKVSAQSCISHYTPLCYSYGKVALADKQAPALVWGIEESVYDTVSLSLLHGRKLSDADAGSHLCMADKSLALAIYGRENIVGRCFTVLISGMSVEVTVAGVVDTGGNLTSMLMGNELPGFLYLPMDIVKLYTGKKGYDQLMLTLADQAQAQTAATQIAASLDSANTGSKVQNMEQTKQTLSGILDLFAAVLSAFGGICLLTGALFSITLMTRNVKEQTAQIGIKKALGASDFSICLEYLTQSAVLSVAGTVLGVLLTALIACFGGKLFLPGLQLSIESFVLPALPGSLLGMLCGIYPACRAAKLRPGKALSKLF